MRWAKREKRDINPTKIKISARINDMEWTGIHLLPKAKVILLEGTRKVIEEDKVKLACFAEKLAVRFPHATFRTGNATGSDEAFAEGIARVNPKALQYVLPYRSMRKKNIMAEAAFYSLEEVCDTDLMCLAEATCEATPANSSFVQYYVKTRVRNRMTSKALYLLRDTLKVLGSEKLNLAPADIGFFYTDPGNPTGGGTGHTMRVCRGRKVPVFDQAEWM